MALSACVCSNNNKAHCLPEKSFHAPVPVKNVSEVNFSTAKENSVSRVRKITHLFCWKPELPVMICREVHSIKHTTCNCCYTSEEQLDYPLQKKCWGAEMKKKWNTNQKENQTSDNHTCVLYLMHINVTVTNYILHWISLTTYLDT